MNGVGPKSWGGRHILPSNHQNKTLRKDHTRFFTGTNTSISLLALEFLNANVVLATILVHVPY
jgi:hypothetical protein